MKTRNPAAVRHAIALVLACLAIIVATGPADAQARTPNGQVDVSLRAASLPGPTYAWVPMPARIAAESDPRVQDPQTRARLQAALDAALQAKGYRRVDDVRQADIAVAYRAGVRDVQQATVRDDSLESAREAAVECRAGGCSQIVVKGDNGVPTIRVDQVDVVEGGLMVEVIQPSDIRVLWRALYRGSLPAKDAGAVNLDAIAKRTLADLPKAPVR
ncbi:MAG TPA: DUF4136 domain-containing protein [Lysobacter sp.]